MGIFRGFVDLIAPPVCHACGRRSYQPVCGECMAMIEVLADPLCPRCGRPVVDDVDLCHSCKRNPPAFDNARSLAVYDFPVRDCVIAMKSASGRAVARRLAPLIRATFADTLANANALTFVPITPARHSHRGHNQSEEIALALSRLTGTRTVGTLRITKSLKDQGGLSGKNRAKNVKGAFALKNGSDRLAKIVKGSSFVLVDDVYTTGATANECARTLKLAGAAEVRVLTLARTPSD